MALIALAFFSFSFVSSNPFKADSAKQVIESVNSSSITENIEVTKRGSLIIGDKTVTEKVSILDNFDEVRLVVLDLPGKYYQTVKINLKLPESNAKNVTSQFIGEHGVGQSSSTVLSSDTILYEASDVSSSATLTVVAEMPKGTINPPFTTKLIKLLTDVKNIWWIAIAIILPTITFFVMLFFLLYQKRRQKIDIPDKESSNPPMAIPPAVVGVLFNQKVGSREIAATLIDLAMRGDIVILDQDRGFAFGKGLFDQRLLGFEKLLLSKIFKRNTTSDQQEIEQRINNHFYSKKISLVSAGIYSLATRLGYFKSNPRNTHAKYRLFGIAFFLLALGGFALNLIYFSSPTYIVFFWIGMMVSALVVAFMAGNMPIRTAIGQEVLSNWLAFRKYLTNPEPIVYSHDVEEIFQKYLPYAIVMNCEASWAKRFREHNFMVPDWFLTEKIGLGLEDFCLSLFPIISYVGRSLAALKEPGFE